MNKIKNLTFAAEGKDRPLFVSEVEDERKIYIVDQTDFDDPSKKSSDPIECLVLEFTENNHELIYRIKQPETFIVMKRGMLHGVLTQ
ncbi:hypothetical protein [uncultured Aquimarina sp.]|uniref:hypothetical protein n=1 Tax=uncultured Aquimarina sp. TaxID=575652 RepID=UPI00262D0EFE|nr:hypothetical protein [uncultured Aquimarina sp.]